MPAPVAQRQPEAENERETARTPIRSYRDLEVWQLAMDLALDVYRLTEAFPKTELYGLTQQMRHTAASIPSNIAAGQACNQLDEYLHRLSVSAGSVAEIETLLRLSATLGYADKAAAEELLEISGRIGQMLNRLSQKLEERRKPV